MNNFHRALIEVYASDGPVAAALPRGRVVAEMEPYWYNAHFESLVIGVTQSAIIQTQADSDFVLTSLSTTSYYTPANIIFPDNGIWWQIRDTASGKTLFNQPLIDYVFTGWRGVPGALSTPRLVLANSNLQVTMKPSGLPTLDPDKAWISLAGVRVYYEV